MIQQLKAAVTRRWSRVREHLVSSRVGLLLRSNPKVKPILAGVIVMCGLYALATTENSPERKLSGGAPAAEFRDGRVFGSSHVSLSKAREDALVKTSRQVVDTVTPLKESLDKLEKRIAELEAGRLVSGSADSSVMSPPDIPAPSDSRLRAGSLPGRGEVSPLGAPELPYPTSQQLGLGGYAMPSMNHGFDSQRPVQHAKRGPAILSFPVKREVAETLGVVLAPGSYVKTKMLTGVAAPEGRPYPALLQLDYAYILPNGRRLDLTGCFMIAKAQGDLSTERLQMQVTKLSCVGRDGRMFEREVNGFVTDDKDNNFAVAGEVVSKQDRVASMAFISSVVEGIGKAVQQEQTTQQTTALSSSQSVTGDQRKYILAGGAAEAAGTVTQWYLRQAQNLLPTINVNSGKDVWVVMQESVSLPSSYFRRLDKGGDLESYSFITRLLE